MLLALFYLVTQVAEASQISPEWRIVSFNITQADFDPKNGKPNPSVVELSFEMQEPDTKDLFLCERDFDAPRSKSGSPSPITLPPKSWRVCASKSRRTAYFKLREISSSETPVVALDMFQMIVRNDSYVNHRNLASLKCVGLKPNFLLGSTAAKGQHR
jgi:hypothetical protein